MQFSLVLSALALTAIAAPAPRRGEDSEFPGGIIRVNSEGKPLRKVGDDWIVDNRLGRDVQINADGTGRRVTTDFGEGVTRTGRLAQVVRFPETI